MMKVSVNRVYEKVGYKNHLATMGSPYSPYMHILCQYPKVLILPHRSLQHAESEVHIS